LFKKPLQEAKPLSTRLYSCDMKRIEIHLTEKETKVLDQIANAEGRSRKNLCETEICKLIERWQKNKATDNVTTKNS
jgi:hypothetical protein